MIRVLLSGGMDSAVCLAWAIRHRLPVGVRYDSDLDIVDAVGFHYGQRHAEKELEAARRIASTCRTRFRVRSLDIGGESSLTGSGELSGSSVVVPGRNRKMLGAAALMQPFPDALVIGACADDAEIFEDCRSEFFDALMAELRVPIHTPLIDMTKREVVALGSELGATNLVIMSWSCYAGNETPCQKCGACLARAEGMAR